MQRLFGTMVLAMAIWATAPALAAERTVTLAVDNLWCATCPYIVRTVLQKVPGVQHVEVSFENRIAVVTFDDAKTDIIALTQATADVGFPSEPLATN